MIFSRDKIWHASPTRAGLKALSEADDESLMCQLDGEVAAIRRLIASEPA
jgi:hypothetical protein